MQKCKNTVSTAIEFNIIVIFDTAVQHRVTKSKYIVVGGTRRRRQTEYRHNPIFLKLILNVPNSDKDGLQSISVCQVSVLIK
jgi:hypothetical protein